MKNEQLRELMYSWHDGQASSLYAAASSGLVADVEQLAADLKHCALIATHSDTTPFSDPNGSEAQTEAATLRQFAEALPTMVGNAFVHPSDRRTYRPLPWAIIPAGAKVTQ